MGSEVTIIGRNQRFLPDEEPEISALAKKELEKRATIITNHEVREVEKTSNGKKRIIATDMDNGCEMTITAQELLRASGRGPNTDILHPEKSGIQTDERGWIIANVFSKDKLVYVGSDFTIHGIIRDYDSGRKINRRCMLINDMTLLLESKAKQTRSRLIDAFSELASEGRYIYRDFQRSHEVKARFSLIANITPLSFLMNRKHLLGNTFIERCLVVYHSLTDEEMSNANINRDQRLAMKIEKFTPSIREGDVNVARDDLVRFDEYAKRWRILGGYSSSSALFDMIKSAAIAYAVLSGHRKMTEAEYRYLDMLESYLRNPDESVKLEILELGHQGRSVKDICQILNKNPEKYRPFVSRTLSEYRRKGILPWTRAVPATELV